MRSYGMPKRKCASISSSPLFASVAESIVIFGPMRHVGCASASSGVTSASSSRVRPRNGPPEPVSTSVSHLVGRGPSRHWKSAECSLSTGQDPRRRRGAGGERELAGRDEALLVREREVDAVLERPERRVDAGEADDGVQHDVGLRALEQLGQVAADLLQRRVDVVERRRAGRDGAELELGVRVRRSRSPGARSSRWRRGARLASSVQSA